LNQFKDGRAALTQDRVLSNPGGRLNRPHLNRPWRWLLLACCLSLLVAAPGRAAEAAREATPRQPVLAQKARLVEQLLGSAKVRAVEAGADADAKATLALARSALAESRAAADDKVGETLLNEALRLLMLATRGPSASAAADEAQARRNTELREQVAAYRADLVKSAQARGLPPPPAVAALDQHLAAAQALSRSARHAEAGELLAQAYRLAVDTLVALRAGETVTIELRFDTPADEYAYELKRYRSHQLLVEMTLDERRPDAAVRSAMDQHTQQAEALNKSAADRAAAGDHRAAIKALEQATQLLVRALQAAGMPVY
jgi:hypothetical protein